MNRTVVTVIILLVVVVGGYFLLKGPEATAPTDGGDTPNEEATEPVSSGMPVIGEEDVEEMIVAHMVTYTNAGFSPNELRIQVGETVTWQNNSTQNMWVASAMHPTHMVYSGTSLSEHCPVGGSMAFDACEGLPPLGELEFAFTKAGTWGYHDHLHPTLFGKVVVE